MLNMTVQLAGPHF